MKRWSEAATFQNHQQCCYFYLFIFFLQSSCTGLFLSNKKNVSVTNSWILFPNKLCHKKNSLPAAKQQTFQFLSNCFIKVALTLNVRCLTPTAAQKLGRCVCLMHMQPHLWVVEAADLGCCLIVVLFPCLCRLDSACVSGFCSIWLCLRYSDISIQAREVMAEKSCQLLEETFRFSLI